MEKIEWFKRNCIESEDEIVQLLNEAERTTGYSIDQYYEACRICMPLPGLNSLKTCLGLLKEMSLIGIKADVAGMAVLHGSKPPL